MPTSAYCIVGRQLADQFAISARLYAEAVVNLTTMGTSPEEYVRLFQNASDTQGRSKAAFIAFDQHMRLHHCRDSARSSRERLRSEERAESLVATA